MLACFQRRRSHTGTGLQCAPWKLVRKTVQQRQVENGHSVSLKTVGGGGGGEMSGGGGGYGKRAAAGHMADPPGGPVLLQMLSLPNTHAVSAPLLIS
jgi:hypothetical protein